MSDHAALLASIAVLIVIVFILTLMLIRRRRAYAEPLIDEMEGHDFEYYCADLLRDNGFHRVEVTRGSGDFGADILAVRDGVTYAVQCKCYNGPVGVHAVQEAAAGRDYYDRMVGAVLTNQYFTAPAAARKLKILLWDRDQISRWEQP